MIGSRGEDMGLWDFLFSAKEPPSWPEVQAVAREFERVANERDARPKDLQTYVSEYRTSSKAWARGYRRDNDPGDTHVVRPPKNSGFKDGEWMPNAEFIHRAKAYMEKA